MKQCNTCKLWKDESEFHKDKTDNTYDAMIQQGFLPLYDCGYLEI